MSAKMIISLLLANAQTMRDVFQSEELIDTS
jgi:hypothetical protein